MAFLLFSLWMGMGAQTPAPAVQQRSFRVPDGGTIFYAISIPPGDEPRQARPLVLVLHPAGANGRPYYGASFMRQIFSPALNELHPIIVAPDCPGRDWSDPVSEKAVMALLKNVMSEHAIDGRRVLVTGFSMGGHGAWFMESRHSDLFTAAIVVAGSTRNEPIGNLAKIPTYVIHSRDDQVVPFEPAERTANELEKMGRQIKFEALEGLDHYQMGAYTGAIRRAGQWVSEHWAK